jgi:uncharacterized protein
MRRPPQDVPPPRPFPRRSGGNSRAGLIAAGVVIFIVLTSLRGVAGFYTDYLWFDELGQSAVFRGVLGTKAVLALVFTAAFFVLMWANLFIADRIAPRFRSLGPEDEIVARYQEVVGPHTGKVRLAVAALFGLIAGTGASSQWNSWILFRNAVDFGVKDPQFGEDVSFFVFRLPFMAYVVDWIFVALILVLVMTGVAHYLNGGIRMQSQVQRVTPQVKGHLSVLLGLLALTRAVDYWLQRFELSFSTRGPVDGATFTDVKAQLPALNLLIVISLAAVVLFIVNIRLRGWVLPVIAVALWGLVSITVGALYPAFIQNFRVKPAENERERPYIARNIEATRAAMGIDGVTAVQYPYSESLTAADLQENAATVRNVRLWDPSRLQATYEKLQEIRRFYQFADVDIDRYRVGDEQRQVVLSVRGLDIDGIPGNSWVNRHLQYTHGYGAVLSSANAVDEDGRPAFLVSGVPPRGEPAITEPRVYFGENMPGYAVVRTRQQEVDFQTESGEDETSTYNGRGGVQLGSFFRRAALALRFNDPNIVISSQVTPRSKVIYIRDIKDRVRKAAPFLAYDSDPYPVVTGGRIVWVQDAYTTTSRYPYAQRADTAGLRDGSGLSSSFNYVRNSVKVVIDAYDGDMKFYVFDDKDPLAKAYAKAFPSLFTSGDELPADLRSHLRYPEDLFSVQARMYGAYHVTNPDSFYRANDAWDVAQDPGTGRVSQRLEGTQTTGTGRQTAAGAPAPVSSRLRRIEPTYLMLRLPGDEREGFIILQPFVPSSANDQQINLTAFLTAKSDPGEYGKLQAFVMPRGEQVDGPLVVNNAIQSTPEIATELTQLDQRGSQALLGNVQVIPIGDSLIYVRPLYVTSEQTELPEVKRVIVVYGGKAVMRPTLQEALSVLFGDAPETLEEQPVGPGGGGSTPPPGGGGEAPADASVQALLDQAATAFAEADAALRRGELATFERRYRDGVRLVERAKAATGGGGSTTSTTAPASAST